MQLTFDDLLNNSINFFEESLSCYSQKKYKYSVINLWAGILLLLKSRLFKEDPILIAEKIEDCIAVKDGESKYSFILPEVEKLKTIDYIQIEKRLTTTKLVSTTFMNYKTKGIFTRIQRMRNTVEHCINSFSQEEMKKMYKETVPFIVEFLYYDLEIKPYNVMKNWYSYSAIKDIKLHDKWKECVEEYIRLHEGNIEVIECNCPECNSIALVVDDVLHCENCGWETKDFYECEKCSELIHSDDERYTKGQHFCKNCISEIEHINEMKEWFFENFESPDEHCVFDSSKDEIIYLNGGPYYAGEELVNQFKNVYTSEEINKAEKDITNTGILEWEKK